jgi:hypothetical protein
MRTTRKQPLVATDDSRPAGGGGEWRVLLSLAVLTVAAIGGLYVIARNADSSGVDSPDALVVPSISTSDGCANFANYWMYESGVGVDASVIEGLTNCWVSETGEWFVPNSPRDERMPDGFALTDDERSATNALRQELLSEIETLETSFSKSIERDLDSIYDPRVRPVSGHIKDGESISRQRSRYTRVIQAYLLNPDNEALSGYVGWLMTARIDAYETLIRACTADASLAHLRTVCFGIEDSMSVRFPPWTWDLRNAVSLEGYLAYLIRTNQLTAAGQEISTAPISTETVAFRTSWLRVVG